MAAIVAIFVLSLGTTVKAALEDSACFTCLSKKQMLEAVVEILGDNLLGENATQEQVLDLLKCLRCASDTQLRAAALYLLCTGFTINT